MKTTVIHHSADYDGIFCREIARKFLPDAELIGWDFADKPIEFPKVGQVYILDLPPEQPFGRELALHEKERVIWIDHHASSLAQYDKFKGYRIDGVAACRLAWQWFQMHEHWNVRAMYPPYDLPSKQNYIDRNILEPLAVRLAGEYDIWDKRDERADVFQFGLRSVDIGADFWEALLQTDGVGEKAVQELLENGYILQRYQNRNDANIVKSRSFLVDFEGLKFLALNTARCNSLTFAALDVPETGHDALMGFSYNGKVWTVSLYHARHRTDLDLSQIAVKHGGGGHKGACGFTSISVPL